MTTASDYRFYKMEVGNAQPIECHYCNFTCYAATNMALHERVHRRTIKS